MVSISSCLFLVFFSIFIFQLQSDEVRWYFGTPRTVWILPETSISTVMSTSCKHGLLYDDVSICYARTRSQVRLGNIINRLDRFKPATFLCLSQARICISSAIYRGIFCIQMFEFYYLLLCNYMYLVHENKIHSFSKKWMFDLYIMVELPSITN